ncbi:MAG: hypothetical protein QOJ77_2190 [Microbacteriaceae bacterium]|nr:hypothetical protein [Microbacteriaceae bacterium]
MRRTAPPQIDIAVALPPQQRIEEDEPMPTDPLTAVADELYGLLPDEFTAMRNDRAHEVRGDDRELASRIQELRRPSPAGWLVNQLVRHRAGHLDAILDVGAELRDAQDELDADALSRLTKQRRQLIAAILRDAGELAEELGNPVRGPVLDEVAQTLQAGMSDATAADAMRSGRLVRALAAVGLEVDVDGAVAGGPALTAATGARRAGGSKARASEASESSEASAAADVAAREARERAEQRTEMAAAALKELDGRVDEHRKWIADITSERDQLEGRLRTVESELADAERKLRSVARERDRAARALELASAAAEQTRDALR